MHLRITYYGLDQWQKCLKNETWLSFFYKEGKLMGKFVQVWMIAMIHISSSKMPTAPARLLGGEV